MALARSIAARFSRLFKAKSRSAEPPADPQHVLGREGEAIAARFLRSNGYKVLYRNFRAPKGGEVDIVCREKTTATLVFVEVKTRTSERFGRPIDAVDRHKQRLIARGALAWLRLLDNPDIAFRFDVVEIVCGGGKPHCNIVRNAFNLPDPYIY